MLVLNCDKYNGNKIGMDFSFVLYDLVCYLVICIVIFCRVFVKLLFWFFDIVIWIMLDKVVYVFED